MGNTNFQTIHQMGTAISDFVKQATGRDSVQNIDMDHITVAQNHRYEEVDVSGRVVSFQAGEAGIPFEKMVIQIMPVQSGSGDPSPENIRPIPGWDSVKVTRTGKNLLNPAKYDWQTRTYNGITYTVLSDGSVRAVGTSTAVGGPGLSSRFQLPAGTYYGNNSSTENGMSVLYRYAKQETDGQTYPTTSPFVSDGTQWFYVNLYCSGANVTIDTVLYPQIELGTSFTGFVPYQGNTYDITFPSEAGTVYGGTLDVTSGVLTVDWANIASYNGETLPGEWISDRDVYAEGTTPTIGSQVVYQLTTPTTYQLTPQEITTLIGQNHIWADTGDIEVKFTNVKELY